MRPTPLALLVAALLAAAPVRAQAPQLEQPLPPPITAPEGQGPAEQDAPPPVVAPPVEEQPAQPQPAPPEPETIRIQTVAPVVGPAPQPVILMTEQAPAAQPPESELPLPAWALSLVLLLGAFLAGLFGVMTAMILRKGEMAQRRRSVAATLAIELETRLQAFESVPLPPNAEAGVFFVSAMTSLSGIDAGFRAAQTDLHLLPGKLASHISVHYAAVQRVADFVKGQSLAAGVRMLQANRMGGHPCPDAGTMREAHVEMAAAFRGLDKLVAGLRATR
jgi:predicted outer membrane lipoprotein